MAGLASYYASAGPYMQFKMGQDIMSGESQAMEKAMSLRNSMLQQQASEMKIKEHLGTLAAIKESISAGPQSVTEQKVSPLNAISGEDYVPPFESITTTSRPETDPELYNRMGTSLMMHPQAGLEGIKTGMGLRQHAETLKKENDKHTLDVFKTVGELAKKVGPQNFPEFYRGLQNKFSELKDVPVESWNIGADGGVKYLDLTAQGFPDDMVVQVGDKLVHVKKTKDMKETWGPEEAGPGGTTRQVSSHGAIKQVYSPPAPREPMEDKQQEKAQKAFEGIMTNVQREIDKVDQRWYASQRLGDKERMTLEEYNRSVKAIKNTYGSMLEPYRKKGLWNGWDKTGEQPQGNEVAQPPSGKTKSGKDYWIWPDGKAYYEPPKG